MQHETDGEPAADRPIEESSQLDERDRAGVLPRSSRREFLSALGAGVALSTTAGSVQAEAFESSLPEQTGAPQAGEMPIVLDINGKSVPMKVEPRTSLLDALRERAGLTGAKKGCDHGQCGACTVLVDGRRVLSCMSLAAMHERQKIVTIEGLASGNKLHPVQAAFLEHDGFQCGFCTPGQIMSAVGLITEGHASSESDIKELMSGNICRCGAYANIVSAIREAMEGGRHASV